MKRGDVVIVDVAYVGAPGSKRRPTTLRMGGRNIAACSSRRSATEIPLARPLSSEPRKPPGEGRSFGEVRVAERHRLRGWQALLEAVASKSSVDRH